MDSGEVICFVVRQRQVACQKESKESPPTSASRSLLLCKHVSWDVCKGIQGEKELENKASDVRPTLFYAPLASYFGGRKLESHTRTILSRS